MTIKEELHVTWETILAVALRPNNKKYEDVPCDWNTFDEFYKQNYQRYYRAKRKWENYIKVTPKKYRYKKKGNYEVRNICLIRKIREYGYTKKNTVFTSLSDRMKYHKTSKKIYINDKLLGTRDVKNILKKQGVNFATVGVINARMNRGMNPFAKENRLKNFKWKGKYMALHEIAEKEGIIYSLLQNRIFHNKMKLHDAINYCKKYEVSEYLFEGEMLPPGEIIKTLSKKLGIKEEVLSNRFYRNNCDYTKIMYVKSDNKYAPYKKKVTAKKDGKSIKFNSITEACETLKLNISSASCYLNGKLSNTNQTKGYELSFI